MKPPSRRPTKQYEIHSKCQGCSFPLCIRHHLLAFGKFEDDRDEVCVMTCPNCHWLAHICQGSQIYGSKVYERHWRWALLNLGQNNPSIQWAIKQMHMAQDLMDQFFTDNLNLQFDPEEDMFEDWNPMEIEMATPTQ